MNSVSRPVLSVLSLCTLLAACSQRGASRLESAARSGTTRATLVGPTVLELLQDEQPLLVARIPGLGELTLLLDTGSQFSWIDEDFACQMQLEREPLDATLLDIQGVRSSIKEVAIIERLELGQLVLSDFRPPVLRTLREGVHGSLGQDVLRAFDVVVDGPGARLLLLPKGTWSAAPNALLDPRSAPYSYELDPRRALPRIRAVVNQMSAEHRFDIDTGSGPMTFSPELLHALNLEATGTEQARGLSHEPIEVQTYFVPKLALDGLSVSGVAQSAPSSRLGWHVLRQTVCVFPHGTKRMLLYPEPRWRAEWSPRQGLGFR